MHTETSTTTATRPTAAEPQLIGAGERKGLHYELHMHGPTAFSFSVRRWNPGGFHVQLHESKPEYPHQGRAELAAERWIDAHAIEETPEAEAPAPAPANEPATKITAGGWLLQLGDDKGGTYKVELIDATTGEVHEDTAEFKGYMSRDQALGEAQQWAQENPLRLTGEANGCTWTVYRTIPLAVEPTPAWSFDVNYPTGAGDRGTFEGRLIYIRPDQALDAARSWCERFRIGAELPGEQVPEPTFIHDEGGEYPPEEAEDEAQAAQVVAPAPAPAPLQAPAAAPTYIAAPADMTVKGLVLDFEEHAEVAQQWHGLTLEIVELEEQLKSLKADLKAKMLQRDLLAGRMSKGILAIASGRSAGPYQARLPLAAATPAAPAPMTQPQLAAAAEKAAHEIEGPEVPWAFNGVDHTILVRPHGDGWRAALHGHEDRTEAFDPDRSAAIEACRQRASIVFEDAEPGSTAIPDPPKKTRGRKKKEVGEEQPPPAEESADAPRVIAALRLSMNLDEAAKKLKISTKTLQKWAAENGVTLSEHLGVELGKDEPAPEPKTNKKPRGGRKSK